MRMMKKVLLSPLVLLMSANAAVADGLSFQFTEDTLRASYNYAPVVGDNTSAEASWIYNDHAESNLLSGGFYVNGTRSELSGRAGVKVYATKIDEDTGGGVVFGGDGAVKINQLMSVFASLYLSPDFLAFGDVDKYAEWRVGIDFSVFENVNVTVSYGELEVGSESYGDVQLEDGLGLSFKMRF